MEYQVLARKYRPRTFADMIGQEHITRTLQNALSRGRTAHAYLFIGTRGIGKTTIARIFAKALNCAKAPAPEPCCECENCLSIARGNCMDVVEIDGASNNSVDNIRNLREEVGYIPTSCKYKVYVIDEVHMLTNAAWNALLKTLEEPPPHVKFLFATTEAHKILPTVVSRCQRFDLKPIPERIIAGRLGEIAALEGVAATRGALSAIARAADGGMRDALSLFDQMIAFHLASEKSAIEEEDVLGAFALTGTKDMESLVTAALAGDPRTVVRSIHALAESGKNLEALFDDILEFLRGIEITLLLQERDAVASVLDVGEDKLDMFQTLAGTTGVSVIQSLLEILSPMGPALHNALNKRVFLETALLKATRLAHAPRVEDVLARMNQLRTKGEFQNLEAVPSVRPPPNPTVHSSPPPNPPPFPRAAEPIDSSVPTPAASQSVMARDERAQVSTPSATVPTLNSVTQPRPAPSAPQTLSSVEPMPNNGLSTAKTFSAVLEQPAPRIAPVMAQETTESTSEKELKNENTNIINESPNSTNEQSAARSFVPTAPQDVWHSLIVEMDKEHVRRPDLKIIMQAGEAESFKDGVLSVVFDEEYRNMNADLIRKSSELLEHCLRRILGIPKARVVIRTAVGVSTVDSLVPKNSKDAWRKAESSPFVRSMVELFKGKIVHVRG